LLLKLPHRQFVFTIPKLLRVYFKNDRNLFEEISKIIFGIVTDLKVYEVDPLVCPKCGSEMKVIAIITDLQEVDKILECLKRNNAPPFDKVVTKVSSFS